uniref:Tonsoku-like protein n=1 Tax=Callorhinchus milii TaxID=7868 RepID=A0A4W3H2Y2_CALMI
MLPLSLCASVCLCLSSARYMTFSPAWVVTLSLSLSLDCVAGQFREAADEHRQELQLSESVKDVIGAAVANRRIGECLAEMGSYKNALKHQRTHLSLARSVDNDIEEQRAWATIGRTYLYMHETSQSRESLSEAEDAFRQSLLIVDEKLGGNTVCERELSEMRARLYLNLGFLYDSTRDSVKSSQYIRKSIFIAEKNNLYEDLYRANFQLSNIRLRSEQHSQAIRSLEAAKECARKMKEKFLESECFSNIGQVLLSLGDLVAGKRSLKQAYRLGSQQDSEHESIRRLLRYAIKGCQVEEALSDLPEGEHLARMGLSEELGDLCCKVGAYRKAVDCYRTQLSEAEAVGRPDRELAVIHVSLATTFNDLKDYKQSVSHYQAELQLRKGNPREVSVKSSRGNGQALPGRTGDCHRAGAYQEAGAEVRVLRLLLSAQQKRGLPQAEGTQARLQELAQHQAGSEEEEEEEEGSETLEESEPLGESELELSDSGTWATVTGCTLYPQWNRRNEKGETVLHRACIEGNLRHAQNLVAKGHPLNPRDYCGWTPLHEACNHGHLEIVQLLLDSGVNMNDPGGSRCEGITPLHDAITCGNFQVAELLIQRGASVTVLNAKGQSPLDSLSDWYQTYSKHLDKDTKQQCCQTQRLLKAALTSGKLEACPRRAGQASQESDLFDSERSELSVSLPSRERGRERRLQETSELSAGNRNLPHPSQRGAGHLAQHIGDPSSSSTQASGDRLSPPGLCDDRDFPDEPDTDWDSSRGRNQERDLEAPNAGRAVYLQAMRGLGSAKSRLLEPGHSTSPPPPPLAGSDRPALVPEEQDLAEDWLEDDLRLARPRKRARGEQHWGAGSSERAAIGSSEESQVQSLTLAPTTHTSSSSVSSSRLGLKNKRRSRQMRMTQIVDRSVLGRSGRSGEQGLGASVPSDACGVLFGVRVVCCVRWWRVCCVCNPHLGLPRDSETRDISWLAEQASQRYYKECGLRPRLTLKKEGALLASDDPVLHVLQSNEEVLAEVMSWDLPPLSDRYKRACQSLATAENRLVLRIMEMQENSACFSLANLSLGPVRLPPVLRALKQQNSTRELCLSGDRLCDRLLGELADTLSTLPGLARLDLANNHITAPGLRVLCDATLRPSHLSFQSLEELDLSLNPLGDACAPSVAHLLTSCPALSTLRLQACRLTARLFHQQRPLLAEAITGKPTLVLSHNQLGSGVETALRSLPHQSLTRLELSCVASSPADPHFLEPLVRYLGQGCALTHLNLSGNRLTDECASDLSRCLLLCGSLVSLDLSANPGITGRGLERLLLAIAGRSVGMQYLSLAGECRYGGGLLVGSLSPSSQDHQQLGFKYKDIIRVIIAPTQWGKGLE